jgi:hypothetical protein
VHAHGRLREQCGDQSFVLLQILHIAWLHMPPALVLNSPGQYAPFSIGQFLTDAPELRIFCIIDRRVDWRPEDVTTLARIAVTTQRQKLLKIIVEDGTFEASSAASSSDSDTSDSSDAEDESLRSPRRDKRECHPDWSEKIDATQSELSVICQDSNVSMCLGPIDWHQW